MATPIDPWGFKAMSDRLISAITPCFYGVLSKLHAADLVAFELNSELIGSKETNSTKSRILVNDLQRQLRNEKEPQVFIRTLCDALKKEGERQLTEIASELESNLTGRPLVTGPSYDEHDGREEVDSGAAAVTLSIPDPPEDVKCPERKDLSVDVIPDNIEGHVKDVNVLLVTATETELLAVIGCSNDIKDCKEVDGGNCTFYLGWYDKYHVAIIETGQGEEKTKNLVKKVQKIVKAQYVIAIGICYGMKESKVKLGDVIVSEKIKDLTNKRAEEGRMVPRTEEYKTPEYIYNIFSKSDGFGFKNSDGPNDSFVKVRLGVLVSETTLVADEKYKQVLLGYVPEALGGEMEGNGLMKAAKELKEEGLGVEAIVIKAVADYGNKDKEPYRKWQDFASIAAAKYVLSRLKRYPNKLQKQQSGADLIDFNNEC